MLEAIAGFGQALSQEEDPWPSWPKRYASRRIRIKQSTLSS